MLVPGFIPVGVTTKMDEPFVRDTMRAFVCLGSLKLEPATTGDTWSDTRPSDDRCSRAAAQAPCVHTRPARCHARRVHCRQRLLASTVLASCAQRTAYLIMAFCRATLKALERLCTAMRCVLFDCILALICATCARGRESSEGQTLR